MSRKSSPRPVPKPKAPSLRDRLGRDGLFRISADLPKVVELDIATLHPNPEQPRARLDPVSLDELRQSIERHGLLQPLLARKPEGGDGYELVAGHRRFEALRALGRATVPAILVSGDPGELALVENLQRQDLNPFEEASAVARLMERHGYTQGEVGAVLGRRQNTVSALLALNRLPDEIRKDCAADPSGLNRSLLIELAQIDDREQQLHVWKIAREGRLTVRDVRHERRKKVKEDQHSPKASAPGAVVRTASRLLKEIKDLPPAVRHDVNVLERLRELHDALVQLLQVSDLDEQEGS